MGALLVVGLVQVRTASASCGDWLDHSKQAAPSPKMANPHTGASHDKTLPCPCRGPLCRQAPVNPSAPAPFVPTLQLSKDFASSLAVIFEPRCRGHELLSGGFAQPRTGFPHRVEHPPRA
jgi:hypothetical protein